MSSLSRTLTLVLIYLGTKPENLEKAGYLMKRGEFHKSWKVRWCKLDGPNRKLLYYKSKDNVKPINHIPLEHSVVRVSNLYKLVFKLFIISSCLLFTEEQMI